MKVSSIALALLVVGLSTASAVPREERGGRVPFTGHKMHGQRPPPIPHHVGDWVSLATPTPTRYGTEWILVGRDQGAFRAIRVQAMSGAVHLRAIRVEFANGNMTTFPVDRWLTARHPEARIDFGAARVIDRIAVTTARRPEGTYVVHGSWGIASTGDLIAIR